MRYMKILDRMSKNHWSSIDNIRLLELHRKFGSRWKTIAGEFPCRTYLAVKNHLCSLLKRIFTKMHQMSQLPSKCESINQIRFKTFTHFLQMPFRLPNLPDGFPPGFGSKCQTFYDFVIYFTVNEIESLSAENMNESTKQVLRHACQTLKSLK